MLPDGKNFRNHNGDLLKRVMMWICVATAAVILSLTVVFAWGWEGHKIVNRKAVIHIPAGLKLFQRNGTFFEAHSSDADLRIDDSDTSFFAETNRHHFDIDDFGVNIRSLSHNLDSLIRKYGWNRMKAEGINPWATVRALDSLTAQLSRGDTTKAKLTASDLGHYVADGHQPLRCTVNNDGQFTGNHGINFRYEFEIISRNSSFITVSYDTVQYISSPIDYIFEYIYHSHSLVDSVIWADNQARATSGWNGTGTPPSGYYDALWEKSKNFTRDQFQRATVATASLWYTAWLNAGLSTEVREDGSVFPISFSLSQNYPNPFNPLTIINYQLTVDNFVSLAVYDLAGKEIATLVHQHQPAGEYRFTWNAEGVASGIYFCKLQTGKFSDVKKMVLMK